MFLKKEDNNEVCLSLSSLQGDIDPKKRHRKKEDNVHLVARDA